MVQSLGKDFNMADFDELLKKTYKDLGRANIMIIGKTGVGKSTLINSVFREEIAKTGVGEPVTQHLCKYTKEGVPVTLYDTKGIELNQETQQQVKEEIITEIDKSYRGPVEERIHLIWFCISYESNRIEDIEIEWIKEFSKQIPVILVLTQCLSDDDTFYNELKNKNLPVKNIIRTLASPKKITGSFSIPSYGLKELVSLSFQVLPEGVRSAFANAQKVDIQQKVDQAWKWSLGFIATSFGVGFTPIPFSDAPILAGIQLTLIATITNIFGFSFSQGLLQTIIGAIAGSGAAAFIGRALVSNLLKFIPGIGTAIGGTISGSIAAILTTSLAAAYIEVCKKLSSIDNIEEMSYDEIAKLVKQEFEKEIRNRS